MSQKIEAVHIRRFRQGQFALSDPCFICGGKRGQCGHDLEDTIAFIARVKKLSAEERRAILEGK